MLASDIIEIIGIIASTTVSIVAIVISLITLKQNNKMIEESTRPVISIYSRYFDQKLWLYKLYYRLHKFRYESHKRRKPSNARKSI